MKENSSLGRIIFGISVIGIGVAMLLDSFDVIDFGHLVENFWPLAIILAAVIVLIDNPRQNYLWAIILAAFGVSSQLNVTGVIDVSIWQLLLPTVLVVIGWSILMKRSVVSSKSSDDTTSILSGAEVSHKSKDFRSSKVTTIVGGSTIDLTEAKIKKEATIEVFVLMGGVELRVPKDWQIRSSAVPVLGGVEDKTQTSKKSGAPVLNIVGTIVMGGIEIKN